MIRLVRLFSGADGQSHVEESHGPMTSHDAVSTFSAQATAQSIHFAETAAGSQLDWHDAPHRRYVITLCGTVEFETCLGQVTTIGPGDLLLAEDETGGGHRWRLVGDQPWRRVYVDLP